MSDVHKKGKSFEQRVASLIRKKLGAKVVRDSRSGAGASKSDIKDYWQELPFHLELKDQKAIAIKKWMRQAIDAASATQIPTVVFHMDEEIIATLRLSDLLNLALEIDQLRAELEELRKPLADNIKFFWSDKEITGIEEVEVDYSPIQPDHGIFLCRNNHIASEYGRCLDKNCVYGRGYRKPKGKRTTKPPSS